MYFSMKEWELVRYEKSKAEGKMYAAILENKEGKTARVNFGDRNMENYRDGTGLNLYPHLIHGDKERRRRFRIRAKHYLKEGYYSPGWFSYYVLW
jgi:hypothetical protein